MTPAKILAGMLAVALLIALAASAASGPVYQAPRAYYLALGDSIAYGFQPAKQRAGLPPSGFNTGYVDVFAARLRAAAPKAEIILSVAWNFDVEHLAQTDPLFRSIDATIVRVAAARKARVAKMYPVFSPSPVGNPARARARICALTFICSKGDPHPT